MFHRKSTAVFKQVWYFNCNQYSEEKETQSEDCNMTVGFE